MSKTVKLTIGERFAALRILDAFKGTITELASVLEDVKKIALTEDEKKVANMVVTVDENKIQTITWNENDEATHKDLKLNTETLDYLVKSIKEKSDKGEVVLTDGALISLNKKLQ